MAGRELGTYELLEEIARGGMGVVFRARDTKLNRIVALKMILTGHLASEKDVRRFYQEAEAAANLDHPGIVPIYEIGQHVGQHFFSMKLLEGGALASQLDTLRSDTRGVVALVAKIARAVHYAHQRGILHRDLKPANILLDDDQQPVVTDLGLAKDVGSQSDLTRTGAVVGTPSYMSPEQASGEKDITTATDIYSLGAILYEALTGRPPHVGESPVATIMQVINESPKPPRELDRNVHASLDLICMKCLQKDPSHRYASAGALADDLENWLAGRAVSARRPSMTTVVTELFNDYLQSAIGAALIGAVAGFLFGLGLLTWSHPLPEFGNQAFSAYEAITGVSYDPWLFRFLMWYRVPGTILGFIVLVFIGPIVQFLVRPRSKEQAYALGGVAGLMMTLSFFAVCMGLFSLAMSIVPTIGLTAEIQKRLTLPDDAASRDKSDGDYSLLLDAPPAEQEELFKQLLMLSSMSSLATGIWGGLITSAVICLTTCIGGTIYANRRYREGDSFFSMIIPSALVGMFLFLLAASITILDISLRFRITFYESIAQPINFRIIVYTVLTLPLIAEFGKWWWPIRWAIHLAAWITIGWFITRL